MMKKKVFAALAAVVLIALLPLLVRKDAAFGGTDDAAGAVVEEVNASYEPWAAPLVENLIGGELPGETESLLFCVQTGIGVGIIAFYMGRFVERKKHVKEEAALHKEGSA